MGAMGIPHLAVLLAAYLSFLTVVRGQVFQFEPVESNGRMADNEGNWTLEGTVTLSNGLSKCIKPTVGINAVGKLCTIDLEDCSPKDIGKMDSACFCKEKKGNKYSVVIMSKARLAQSGLKLQASMTSSNALNPVTMGATTIGTVPKVVDTDDKGAALKGTITINGEEPTTLARNSVARVCSGTFNTIKICVKGKDAATSISLTINGQMTSTRDECVEMARFYDFKTDAYSLKFTHKDTTGVDVIHASIIEKQDGCSTTGLGGVGGVIVISPRNRNARVPMASSTSSVVDACLDARGTKVDNNLLLVTLPRGGKVLCETQKDNGGWTYVQRRRAGTVNFFRNWHDYVTGFGKYPDEFWLGLENLHQLCSEKCELRFNLGDVRGHSLPENFRAKYTYFKVRAASDYYRMTVSGYSGTIADSLVQGNNFRFYTWDRHRDEYTNNVHSFNKGSCPYWYYSGWWFNNQQNCGHSNINGLFNNDGVPSMHWAEPRRASKRTSITYTEMLVRPVTRLVDVCSNAMKTGSGDRIQVIRADGQRFVCETQGNGGGWTIIQRHAQTYSDFSRTYAEYKKGFGDISPSGDFWFGLDKLREMCGERLSCELRIDMEYKGKRYYATYSDFRISKTNYKLYINGYKGTAGDQMRHHNNMEFSTHDFRWTVCAKALRGGWWYKSNTATSCSKVNANGNLGARNGRAAVTWPSLTGEMDSLTFIEMKVRSQMMKKEEIEPGVYDLFGDGEKWKLAFRGTAGIRKSVWDAFESDKTAEVVEPACKKVFSSEPCKNHYKNYDIFNKWEDIDEVAFVLFKGTSRVRFFKFDGRKTNKLNWFQYKNIIDSSYENIKPEWQKPGWFNLRGDPKLKRRFLINHVWGASCNNHQGWFFAMDRDGIKIPACTYEKYKDWPTFAFSSNYETSARWYQKQNIDEADYLGIFVKYKVNYFLPCYNAMLKGSVDRDLIDGVPCEAKSNGGGWTIIQRHADKKTNFYRTIKEYQKGFGTISPSEDFWLGLNKIVGMCVERYSCELRIDMGYKGQRYWATYSDFKVEDSTYYTLRVKGYKGTAGDQLRHANHKRFSTQDHSWTTCARALQGGWWYTSNTATSCTKVNPNGNLGLTNSRAAATWQSLTGEMDSLDYIEMKVRSQMLKKQESKTEPGVYDVFGDGVKWQLAFRGTPGVNKSVYDAFNGDKPDGEVQPGCKKVYSSEPCNNHYKNYDLFNKWEDIEEIALVLFKGTNRVRFFKFDVKGRTKSNWFHQSRVIDSSYLNIVNRQNIHYFTLPGDVARKRRFLIYRLNGNCNTDVGWFMALDKDNSKTPNCPHEKYEDWPRFIYSHDYKTYAKWNQKEFVREADYIGIFFKFKVNYIMPCYNAWVKGSVDRLMDGTVPCEAKGNGGGWTIIQRHTERSSDFTRKWSEYVNGFGSVTPYTDFWIGLQKVREMCNQPSSCTLRVDLEYNGKRYWATYSDFSLADSVYTLKIGGYKGTAGNDLSYHNNQRFSTIDVFHKGCANKYGGWWHRKGNLDVCAKTGPNGKLGLNGQGSMVWNSLTTMKSSLTSFEMKVRSNMLGGKRDTSKPGVYDVFGDGTEWHLWFRGTAGVKKSVYGALNANKTSKDVAPGCKKVFSTDSCNDHYRNDAIYSDWKRVEEISFVLFKGEKRVAFLTFDASHSTCKNWFDKARLQSSSWGDLNRGSRSNYFSMIGIDSSTVSRRFYVSHLHKGCPGDIGWFAALDRASPPNSHCTWARYADWPTFIYSNTGRISKWSDKQYISQADYIGIFVKLGQAPKPQFYDVFFNNVRTWRLAFRGTAGIGKSIYDAFVAQTGPDVAQECKEVFSAKPCNDHYKNYDIFKNWNNIQTVAFVLFKGDKKVAFISFNGANTNWKNWFAKNRVISSSWSTLKHRNFIDFKIDGHPTLKRRFNIHAAGGGCTRDAGFIVVQDRHDINRSPCHWGRVGGNKWPLILYNTNWGANPHSYHHYPQYRSYADYFAIFVMYKP